MFFDKIWRRLSLHKSKGGFISFLSQTVEQRPVSLRVSISIRLAGPEIIAFLILVSFTDLRYSWVVDSNLY